MQTTDNKSEMESSKKKSKDETKRSKRTKTSKSVDPTGFYVSDVHHSIDEIWMTPQTNNSVFEFQDISYSVGKGRKQKQILANVSGCITNGSTVAILGPSGAGKTSLLKALSLGITSGKVTGTIKLNGETLTNQRFKDSCFLVEQFDHHWPFLTCKETIMDAASLLLGPGNHSAVVECIIDRMGLSSCKDTKVGNDFIQGLSGGQKRRLSLAIALLKKPAVIMLDEPTSGLDSAASVAIVSELKKLAKSENLIIIMTIHQPSTRVYNDFDQVMLMSKGRQAYMGKASTAHNYFASIGHPMIQMTNPSEFLVDLVNSDFTSEDSVLSILNEWEHQTGLIREHKAKNLVADSNADKFHQLASQEKSLLHELSALLRRHTLLIARDPILYLGRVVVLVIFNALFALAYWNSRNKVQAQIFNFTYAINWPIIMGTMIAVVAVFSLNAEQKSVMREVKNGMIRPLTYITAKSFLVLPVMIVFGMAALSVGLYGILEIKANYIEYVMMYAVSIFVFECIAEVFAIAFSNPVFGMLCYLSAWFTSFLFAGTFLPVDDLPVVVRWIYYVMPLSYIFDAFAYHTFSAEEWSSCTPDASNTAICINFSEFPGEEPYDLILNALSRFMSSVSGEDNRLKSMIILLGMAIGYKFLYIGIFLYKASQSTKLREPLLSITEKSRPDSSSEELSESS